MKKAILGVMAIFVVMSMFVVVSSVNSVAMLPIQGEGFIADGGNDNVITCKTCFVDPVYRDHPWGGDR